ncbi:MAG: 2-oxoglutarate dehydrogenase E1 component [Phycisphaerales bacterium]|jgi:2-oxoglutarate dehydrogenase E1 component
MSSPPRAVVPSLNSWSAEYLDDRYRAYQEDPNSVDAEMRGFFRGFDLANGITPGTPPEFGKTPSTPTPSTPPLSGSAAPIESARSGSAKITPASGRPAGRASHFQAVVDDLITAYRDHGHLTAKIDPFDRERDRPETLQLEYHQLTEADLSRPVDGSSLGLTGSVSLRDVVDRLEQIYCGSVGVEFMHIQDVQQRAWLFDRYESAGGRIELSRGNRAHILELLTKSELFERFLGKRYPGEKRFSLEGSESLIPLLDRLIESAGDMDVEEIVIGMAHRGRLNVLNNILGKTYEQIFTEFEDSWTEDFVDGGGDVKYHRGYSGTHRSPSGKMVHLALASNPSHLEAVNGVVEGRCRAKQRLRADTERRRVIPVLIHGDAAIAGQGVIQELLNYSQLEGYTTGGTVHIVVNNQIGFTTVPEDGRSTRYCTDVGKMIDAPIFHVNGEDPEAVVAVTQFAIEFRQKFRRDCFIDLQCYRRYGHNEQDETSFTQPVMAAMIKRKKSVLSDYSDQLMQAGVILDSDKRAIQARIDETLEQSQKTARSKPNDPTIDPGSSRWAGFSHEFSFDPVETAVSTETIAEVLESIGRVPEGFNLNPKLKRVFDGRSNLLETRAISYADAESLAWATLLIEGHPIRVSGQDSRRGTFSHRHAVVRDFTSGQPYIPLNNIREVGEFATDHAPGTVGPDGKVRQATLCVYDSPLSEASVLAFDYGYSLSDPSMLVCWEAQFGDFCNGAQVIIDQFLASAEQKWDRWSGLVMLLPHGYEGAGPEHSSARMERFLKLCGGDNMQVVYPSTAGQCFHMFRRQLRRPFRKPLIVMTPKSLLRIPTGDIADLSTGTFEEFLDDPMFVSGDQDRSKVRQVILCCGKIYWELDERRKQTGRTDLAILRVEQVFPFHREKIAAMLAQYPEAAERCYAQEEPYNAAAYLFINNKLENELGMERLRFIGRPSSASPATGSKKQHKHEQEVIISQAVGPKPEPKEAVKGNDQSPGRSKLAASA